HRQLAAHPRVRQQRAPDPHRGGHPHGADRVFVPQLMALHRDHGPDTADLADRHLHVHADVRLHHQHDHADGAEFVCGPLDRRRDCGAREHRAPCANGQKCLQGLFGGHT
ncbi:putative Multidrug resistance protein MdtB, partial [Daphnia magna]